ncbi:MAG: hypothetical protein KAI64_06685 [Thermoplasmata archaeon]|nr:hypothetical protein [Thermoplasmata archaeon]
MSFQETFEKLKNTTKGKIIAIGLILLINTVLLFFSWVGCIIIMLIPVATFGVQYLFGERELKWFILLGLVLLLVTGLIYGAILAIDFNNYETTPLEGRTSDGTLVLSNGAVTPFVGTGNNRFNFTVTYQDSSGNMPAVMNVNMVSVLTAANETKLMNELDAGDTNTTDGKQYYYEATLAEDVYYYMFISQTSSLEWANTTTTNLGTYELGPVNIPITQFMVIGLYNLPLFAMIYFLVVMLYWWSAKAKAKTYAPAPKPHEKKEEEDEFTCSKCNADVPANAKKCPKCGEAFDEEGEDKAVPAEISEKMEKGRLYCKVCNDNITKGDTVLGCQCGRYYHLKCALKNKRCPHCGTDFE